MSDVSQYIGLDYNHDTFNCWHLAVKVLQEVYNITLPDVPGDVIGTRVDKPGDGNLVVMYNMFNKKPEHVGVCVGYNQVLHCHSKSTVSLINYISSCKKMFWKIEYYDINKCI